MEALRALYGGDSSSDSESEASSPSEALSAKPNSTSTADTVNLPSPPLSLLTPPTALVYIPFTSKKKVTLFLGKASNLVPGLHLVDVDVPLALLGKDDQKLEQVALGREFHISLGRTVPIRVHQIDSMVAMLRQKLQNQTRYWIDFSKWEVFVNDDQTRSFLSIEVITGGLAEITKQIEAVDEVYKLHNLPEFCKNPRPHISLAWALGDMSDSLKTVAEDEMKRSSVKDSSGRRIFTCKFSGIECKIGNKTYKICRVPDDC